MMDKKFDKNGRLLFTKQMKQDYLILMPMMLPIHFSFMQKILTKHGYKVELLKTNHPQIVNEGLQSVHNDTCYPALLVIGQLIDAVKSGKYDKEKIALFMSQTGGGCRASNYIFLLRRALKRHGLEDIPVVSFSISNMEKNPGFKLTVPMMMQFVNAILYGDMLMLLSNQTRPYELNPGETDALIQKWYDRLLKNVSFRDFYWTSKVNLNLREMAKDFADIAQSRRKCVQVGIVGEIYIKYAPLGNNNLEAFLQSEGVEVTVPGLLDFVLYMADNPINDSSYYGFSRAKAILWQQLKTYLEKRQNELIAAVKTQPKFRSPSTFGHLKSLVRSCLSPGVKMGEGWLLTAEMLELIDSGVPNIVCTQPFGCLPNHIVGKGMMRLVKDLNPGANIVAIDYDPGATKINQENRIKLMLANAVKNLENKEPEKQPGSEDFASTTNSKGRH
ncbi:MAG: 2-hydroxyacyl-CoA dehydratase [Bacillota bacterium]|nr:2-hydroxyacyl-CoA dehydratase [Bacillota bacterium]